MARVLYLVHRLPFPPNKGDKVRSYHLLKHLLTQHEVYLGTFIDDPEDWQYLPRLKTLCREVEVVGLNPRLAKLASLRALLTGEPLTLTYYRDAGLQAWVDRLMREVKPDAVVVFSSSMVQYVEAYPEVPLFLDLVDVDSAKWTAYADKHAWPMSWLYRREGARLLAYERQAVQQAKHSFLVTEAETALFHRLAPESVSRVSTSGNGVDAEFFTPTPDSASPYPLGEQAIVFTGAMDYWPNIDAVNWFAKDIFPALQARYPASRFYIVGRSPTPDVQALAQIAGVVVTGTVADVRPYLQHATVVVAPLRVARGIQNKILEAMAMGRPVVAAASCVDVLVPEAQAAVRATTDQASVEQAVAELLDQPALATALGEAGRQAVLDHYSWQAHLSVLDRYMVTATEGA